MSIRDDIVSLAEEVVEMDGQEVTYRPQTGLAATIYGIFDRSQFEAETDNGSLVMYSATMRVKASDCPYLAEDDEFQVGSETFRVGRVLGDEYGHKTAALVRV